MKKTSFTLAFLLYLIISSNAQSTYLKFGIGYGLPMASQQIGQNITQTSSTTIEPQTGSEEPHITSSQQVVNGSYGSGFNLGASFGYMFSENIGVDLGLSYVIGKRYETTDTDNDSRLGIPTNASTSYEKSYANSIALAPLMHLTAGNGVIRPYVMIGPVFSFQKIHKETSNNGFSSSSQNKTTVYSGGISLGVRAVAGATLAIGARTSFFLELSFTNMNYYPRQSEITKYTVNDQNMLSNLSVNSRKTTYEKSVSYNSDDDVSLSDQQNTPAKALRFPFAMSSITTSIGIRFNLGS